jgi:MFS family permease
MELERLSGIITMLAALMTLVVALTSSVYSGTIDDLVAHFPGYGVDVYILGLSMFVLGFALGPLLWAPASEVFGRRNIFILTYAVRYTDVLYVSISTNSYF